MGLREQAAIDCKTILEDSATGFGWPITVINPDGTSAALTGFSTDIAHSIDPDTGAAVTGRKASVALSIEALTTAGLGMPRGIAEGAGKPWLVRFEDIHGNAQAFKVRETAPDRAIGLVVCWLEAYRTS